MNDLFKLGFGSPASLSGNLGLEVTLNLDFSGFLGGGGLGAGFAPGLLPSFGGAPALRGLTPPSLGSTAIAITAGSPVGARNDVVLCVRSPGSACSCGKS